MLRILRDYYRMNVESIHNGYFEYQQNHYYIAQVDSTFMQLYSQYDFFIHQLNANGYKIVKNCFQQLFSQNYIVFIYEFEVIDLRRYLAVILKPIPFQTLMVADIKERWINKIDLVREEISKYAYSFQFDRDLNALMHYYCGMAENGVCILNEILKIQKDAKLSLSLTLKHPIQAYYYELLNPCYYTISTKARHILNLMKSQIIDRAYLKQIIEQSYFQIYELLYLYARLFYSSEFFDCVLNHQMTSENIHFFLQNYKKEIISIQAIRNLISEYISLPEISWIENENMI